MRTPLTTPPARPGPTPDPSEHRAGDRDPASARSRWQRWRTLGADAGMATAEYAIVTVAAAGFGGLLLLLLRSDEVRGLLLGIIRGALTP